MKKTYLLFLIVGFIACTHKKNPNLLEGKIERDPLSVVSKLPGKIDSIYVQEGSFVKAGDTLIILEIPEVEAKKQQAEGALNSAEAQYKMAQIGATKGQLIQLNAKVSGLKEQLEYAEKSMHRLQGMLVDSLIPQQQFDEVYAKYQGAKSQYTAAMAELEEAKSGARKEQQLMALGQQERAQGALNEVSIAEKDRVIRAPQDMSIESITLKAGEMALPGYSLVNGFSNKSTYFRFTIAENQLNKVKQGESVKVFVPYADRNIEGKIVWIKVLSAYANITSAYPDYEQGQSLFEIKVVPDNPEEAKDLVVKSTVQLVLDDKK